jgi:hypothetical protein
LAADALARAYEAGPPGFGVARALEPIGTESLDGGLAWLCLGHPHRTGQPGAELHDLCTTRTYTLTEFSSR